MRENGSHFTAEATELQRVEPVERTLRADKNTHIVIVTTYKQPCHMSLKVL